MMGLEWWVIPAGLLLGGGGLAAVYAVYLYGDRIDTSEVSATASDGGRQTYKLLTSYRAKALYFSIAVLLACVGIIYVSWTYAGPIDTLIYVFLFLFTLGFFPTLIGLLGSAFPGSNLTGKLHLILGAFAYGNMILVQFDDRFDLCPATDTHVYIDQQWHEIKGGHTNWSILGWRPFGILRYKSEETLQEERVDTAAERARGAAADGGELRRGSFIEAAAPPVTGIDGEWVIDLKRVFSRGIKQIGDIDLIETAEEITSRKHAKEGITDSFGAQIGVVIGIIIGIATGYLVLGG